MIMHQGAELASDEGSKLPARVGLDVGQCQAILRTTWPSDWSGRLLELVQNGCRRSKDHERLIMSEYPDSGDSFNEATSASNLAVD